MTPRRIGWASLLARVFAIDVTVCSKCGGRMKIVEVVTDPGAIATPRRGLRRTTPGILSYYTHRLTNAFSEGSNGVIERIKNTARGYRNLKSFKTAIFFHCGGLKLENMTLASG